MHSEAFLAVVLAAIAFAGCAGAPAPQGGITGHALVGPTCPVQRDPPDPACADKPYQGPLVALDAAGTQRASASTDAAGAFVLRVPAGTYTVASPGGGLPRCSSAEVHVLDDMLVDVAVSCDSGIR